MNQQQLKQQLIAWRHYLHAHPESAFEEQNTSRFIAEKLEAMGIEVHRDIGKTDAIQLTEQGDWSYRSMTAERMHGCGHDGHTCIALGAAQLLLQRQNFNGTVCFVFQPAEEPGYGARAMMDDGVIERFGIEEIYGLHNMPGMKAGTIATRILALQTIVSRNVDPNVPAVISCTELHTDGIRNAIPTHVEIKGDTRSFAPEVQMLLEERMRTISEAICAMHGATCQFSYTHEFAPTVNWQQCVDVAVTAAINVVGAEKVDGNVAQMMISEDFGAFLQKIPGCFIFLGNGDSSDAQGNTPLHNACYDFNDEILLTGAEYFAEVVRTRLPQE
ncbi:amidohydrolase [Klebsiella pneumoniae]|nr:amidohydrolase [Klebsiella pneumoniae]